MKFHISIMYYFCLYKLHGCWKHLVNQEILKVQKPLSIMDSNCQYVVWQDIQLLAINKIFNRKSTTFCSHSYI